MKSTVTNQADLSTLAGHASLESLALDTNEMEDIDLSPLASCTALQELEVVGHRLHSIDLSPLASCDALRRIYLDGDSMWYIDLSPLPSCAALQTLILHARYVDDIDLSPLASCTALQEFGFLGSGLDSIDLSPLASCTSLRKLELVVRNLWNVDLSPLASCTSLRELEVCMSNLGRVDLSPLASCSGLTEFREFAIAKDPNFGPFDWPEDKHWAPLVWCIHLRDISVGFPLSGVPRGAKVSGDLSEWSKFRKFVRSARRSIYRSNVVLYMLGISDLGFVDADLFPVFKSVPKTASLDEARLATREAIIPFVCEQIDRGGTTIGIDIDRLASECPEIAKRVPRVLELRGKEIEKLSIDPKRANLQLLWLTAYGFAVLNQLRLRGFRDLDSTAHCIDAQTRTALGSIGVRLRTAGEKAPASTADGGTVMSDEMRDYILDWARDERGYQPRAPQQR